MQMWNFFCYTVIYFLFYRFSGAHRKPTSDSRYDPTLEHQSNVWYRLVRWYEYRLTRKLFDNIDRDPLPKMGLPELETASPLLFNYLTQKKTHPVVIKGLFSNTNAVKNWCSDYFKEHYGDTSLLTLTGTFNTKNAYTSFTQKAQCQYMPLRESITNMLANKGKYYVNNVTEIFMKHPELLDDLQLNTLKSLDNSIDKNSWLKLNLFLGGPDTASSLHCAVGGNFFVNVVGKKRWTLIDPKYTPHFKTTPSSNFGFVISGYDLEDPEQMYTLNRTIPMYEVVLEPGDCLYVPPWWLHHVRNKTDFTIGVAIRDHTVYTQCWKNNPMFMLLSPYWYKLHPWILKTLTKIMGRDYLLKNSMQSDRHIMSHLTGKLI